LIPQLPVRKQYFGPQLPGLDCTSRLDAGNTIGTIGLEAAADIKVKNVATVKKCMFPEFELLVVRKGS